MDALLNDERFSALMCDLGGTSVVILWIVKRAEKNLYVYNYQEKMNIMYMFQYLNNIVSIKKISVFVLVPRALRTKISAAACFNSMSS